MTRPSQPHYLAPGGPIRSRSLDSSALALGVGARVLALCITWEPWLPSDLCGPRPVLGVMRAHSAVHHQVQRVGVQEKFWAPATPRACVGEYSDQALDAAGLLSSRRTSRMLMANFRPSF